MMDLVKQFASLAEPFLARLAEQAAKIDPIFLAALFAALLLFSLLSRRWLTIVACAYLAAIGYFLTVAPGSATIVLAIGGWLGSFLVASAGLLAHRRASFRQREHENLIESVRRLEAVAERHFLQSLKAPPRAALEPEPDKGPS